jgi:hypothetical protein
VTLKEHLLPSSICFLSTMLLYSSIPDVLFPVPLPTLIRSQCQVKPATLLTLIDLISSLVVGCACHAQSMAWTNRVIFPKLIMWATVLWLFGCLASLYGPLVTKSLFSQTCLSHLLLGVAWAVASFSREEGGDIKHTFYGSYLQSMLKLVPWFVVTGVFTVLDMKLAPFP